MPLGLDMVIGSVKRNYEILPPDHPAMLCLEDCLKLDGFDVLMRVRSFMRELELIASRMRHTAKPIAYPLIPNPLIPNP